MKSRTKDLIFHVTPLLGITIPPRMLRRFWVMLSHYHGQVINYSEIGRSFGISDVTVRKYIDVLEGTFMVRVLQPWYANIGKRIIKRPKIYLRDSGIFHTLMNLDSIDDLISHPKLGASWEGFALNCLITHLGKSESNFYFWNVHAGSEIDLFRQQNGKNLGVEFKYADAPKLTRSMKVVQKDLELSHIWVIYPGRDIYRLSDSITVIPLSSLNEIGAIRRLVL